MKHIWGAAYLYLFAAYTLPDLRLFSKGNGLAITENHSDAVGLLTIGTFMQFLQT